MLFTSTFSKKILFGLFIILFTQFNGFGQSSKAVKELQKARIALKEDDFDAAWVHIEKALSKDPEYLDALLMAADVKMYEQKTKEAIAYYESALRIANKPYIKYKLALAYRDDLRYDDGLVLLRQFENERQIPKEKQEEFQQLMSNMEFGAQAIKHPVPFAPVDLGGGINTLAMEYFPSINARGDVLVFTSRMTEGPKQDEDFFASVLVDSTWQKAERLDGYLNTSDNEGAQSLSADGTELFFTGCHRQDGYGSCDIYISLYRNGLWTKPRNLGRSINTGNWESQPSISPDGKTLYFVRGKSGYNTNTTIMQATRNTDGSFSAATPIDGPINTPFEDASPFIHFDNQTLYFTSNGHPGMGAKDLYYSKKQPDGRWGEPINLGYPINTPFDEFSLIVGPDGKTGYFSSNRNKGGEDLDLFSFQLPAQSRAIATTYVIGKVVDVANGKPVETEVDFYDLSNNTSFQQLQTDANGNFFGVMPKDRNFAVFINEKGYLPFSENYELTGVDTEDNFKLKISLTPIKPGTKFTLTNILFDTDSYELKPESFAELDRLTTFLVANPTLKATLNGHTDNEGSPAHNKTLSANRAKAVVDYLVDKGIKKERLSYKGYGDTQPIANNNTPQGRKQNRRTEVVLN